LAIKDDGRGFESSQAPHQGLGLEIMQERAQAIGAKFSINSHPGMGTQVNVTWNQGGSYE
jgi:signal transduction histidine kinase